MRILHVVPSYIPAVRYGGPIQSVHGLCAALARRGHDVQVYTTNVDGEGLSDVPVGEPVFIDGVTVRYFATGQARRIFRSPAMKTMLECHLSEFQISHLHSVFLWPTTAAARTARRLGVPYVLSPRGMLVPELIKRKNRIIKQSWIELFDRRNLSAAAAVHVTSDLEAEGLRSLGLVTRCLATIPNGVDLPPQELATIRKWEMLDADPVVLFLGRINWKKGLDRLIPAMAHTSGAQLIVAGNDEEGYAPQLLSLVRQHGIGDRVHFIGSLYGAEKWRVIAAADVLVLPSYSENFGIVVLEAMASGVPVIVTPEVGLAATVSATGAGLVVEGHPEKLGAAIATLLADPLQRRRMGEAGRDAARRLFSWDVIAHQMERLYASVIEESLSARSLGVASAQ